jgi:hypothetical protein
MKKKHHPTLKELLKANEQLSETAIELTSDRDCCRRTIERLGEEKAAMEKEIARLNDRVSRLRDALSFWFGLVQRYRKSCLVLAACDEFPSVDPLEQKLLLHEDIERRAAYADILAAPPTEAALEEHDNRSVDHAGPEEPSATYLEAFSRRYPRDRVWTHPQPSATPISDYRPGSVLTLGGKNLCTTSVA